MPQFPQVRAPGFTPGAGLSPVVAAFEGADPALAAHSVARESSAGSPRGRVLSPCVNAIGISGNTVGGRWSEPSVDRDSRGAERDDAALWRCQEQRGLVPRADLVPRGVSIRVRRGGCSRSSGQLEHVAELHRRAAWAVR